MCITSTVSLGSLIKRIGCMQPVRPRSASRGFPNAHKHALYNFKFWVRDASCPCQLFRLKHFPFQVIEQKLGQLPKSRAKRAREAWEEGERARAGECGRWASARGRTTLLWWWLMVQTTECRRMLRFPRFLCTQLELEKKAQRVKKVSQDHQGSDVLSNCVQRLAFPRFPEPRSINAV